MADKEKVDVIVDAENVISEDDLNENDVLEDDGGRGVVKISDEVISIVATMATSEVAGVHSMSGNITSGLVEFLGGKKSASKGIKVSIDDDGNVSLDIHVTITYGFKIPDVAWEIQENVKKAVEDLTGMPVVKVNIHVDGVNIEKSKKEENDETEEPETGEVEE